MVFELSIIWFYMVFYQHRSASNTPDWIHFNIDRSNIGVFPYVDLLSSTFVGTVPYFTCEVSFMFTLVFYTEVRMFGESTFIWQTTLHSTNLHIPTSSTIGKKYGKKMTL